MEPSAWKVNRPVRSSLEIYMGLFGLDGVGWMVWNEVLKFKLPICIERRRELHLEGSRLCMFVITVILGVLRRDGQTRGYEARRQGQALR